MQSWRPVGPGQGDSGSRVACSQSLPRKNSLKTPGISGRCLGQTASESMGARSKSREGSCKSRVIPGPVHEIQGAILMGSQSQFQEGPCKSRVLRSTEQGPGSNEAPLCKIRGQTSHDFSLRLGRAPPHRMRPRDQAARSKGKSGGIPVPVSGHLVQIE